MNAINLNQRNVLFKYLALTILVLAAGVGWYLQTNFRHQDVRYVLVVDAGSVGSRIHIFTFEHQSSDPKLVNEVFDYSVPGLSSYADDDPWSAAESLEPLIRKALESVPKKCYKYTPIAVKATAGLRLLGQAQSGRILDAVYDMLVDYPFPIQSVEIMDGKEEGVYAWTTVNYLLGNFASSSNFRSRESELNSTTSSNEPQHKPHKKSSNTAAVFDLGGASAQVVFEPDFTGIDEPHMISSHGDHIYDMKYGQNHYKLYQHSHLGYGLMEARKEVHRVVAEKQRGRSMLWNEIKVRDGDVLVNPCISTGSKRSLQLDVSRTKLGRPRYVNVTMVGPEQAAPEECLDIARRLLNKDKECPSGHCGFNGIHQPSLADTFANEPLYIVSYFYDRIFPLGVQQSFPLSQLYGLVDNVCQGRSTWQKEYYSAIDELEERPEWCLDLSYMLVLLHDGYGIPLDREVTIGKQVDGYGLSWSLGAALHLLKLPVQEEVLD